MLDDEYEDGFESLRVISVSGGVAELSPTVMVVAHQPGYEHAFGTFYWFLADVEYFPTE